MVEGAFNKTFTNDCIVFNKKHLTQDLFKVSLNIEKPSRTIGSQKFSWANQRQGKEMIMAHLDKLYGSRTKQKYKEKTTWT